MTRLKYYTVEKETYPLEENMFIEDHKTELIARKIARHFKFILREIRFYGTYYSNSGMAYSDGDMRLPHKTNILLLAHELGHLLKWKKYRNMGHDKKLASAIRRIIGYMRKKNYWRE